jgi:hypothetical protein
LLALPVAFALAACAASARARLVAGHHRELLLFVHGHAVIDRQWDEQLLDTSTAAKRLALARIVGGWMSGCARAGFQAVEPDNLDSWQRSEKALSKRDDLALAGALATRAHTAAR